MKQSTVWADKDQVISTTDSIFDETDTVFETGGVSYNINKYFLRDLEIYLDRILIYQNHCSHIDW